VGLVEWGPDIAEVYDATWADAFEPAVLEPLVSTLADLANGERALEFAVGTGRVALPLSRQGVPVHGIDLSPAMVAELGKKPGAHAIEITVGDMCSTRVRGMFGLVYLVFNAIINVTSQDEQVAVFENAARHLEPGGVFVVEVSVPQLRRVPPGELGRVSTMEADHIGIETFDDVVGQTAWSHHWVRVNGRLVRHSAPYRYVWPAELDLMARIAGLRLRARWSGWDRRPFTGEDADQVAVYEKPV
jgi:SAM-dependent methyltransferase